MPFRAHRLRKCFLRSSIGSCHNFGCRWRSRPHNRRRLCNVFCTHHFRRCNLPGKWIMWKVMCYIGSSQKCAFSRVTQAEVIRKATKRGQITKHINCTFYCMCYFTQPLYQVINVFGKTCGHVHVIFQACCSIFLASGQENTSNAFFAFCFLSVLFFQTFFQKSITL